MDSFGKEKFNTAIEMGIARGYIVAWSNECFELWFIQHFEFFHTALPRNQYFNKLGQIISSKTGIKQTYKKNSSEMFNFLMKHGSLRNAIKNSEKLLVESCCTKNYSEKKPATNVVEIVKLLLQEGNCNIN